MKKYFFFGNILSVYQKIFLKKYYILSCRKNIFRKNIFFQKVSFRQLREYYFLKNIFWITEKIFTPKNNILPSPGSELIFKIDKQLIKIFPWKRSVQKTF